MQTSCLIPRLAVVLLGAVLYCAGIPAFAASPDSAVVVMYHRIGEDNFPTTNIRIDQLEAHIEELRRGPYTVLPVADIIAALREGSDLPDRTIGITIDDAYRSIYTQAWPRLKAAGLPFTIFVATDPVDQGLPGYLTWDQIREMRNGGVTIGAHTVTHLHMADHSADRNRREIERSLVRFEKELGERPTLFAYPYGETSIAVRDVVGEFGFAAEFGQHSGAIHRTADGHYLPRFAMNETYGVFDDFYLRVNTVGLPVGDITPLDPHVRDNNPPPVGFTVDSSFGSLAGLVCYHSQFGKLDVELLGAHRVEIRFPGSLQAGRTRLNCTKSAGGGRWYWFGMQYYTTPE